MSKTKEFFKGKKAYIVGSLTFLIAVVNFLAGDMSITDLLSDPSTSELLVLILGANGLGIVTLRAGVSKIANELNK